ncbi:MAG: DNA polymerase IV [Firmicutes bacterium]|nr:DNA polymerase IV [Bacillota bacterium]
MRSKQDILLCDLDAFYAAVEQRDHPRLQGRPVIVGGDPRGRGVVSTCSYEARKFGVRSAMPVKKAIELCPQAVLLPVNMPRYEEVSGQVRQILQRFTPDIEYVSIDEAYLAVKSGTGFQTGERIRAAIKDDLRLPISVGVSINKLLSKVACGLAKPDNIKTLWPEQIPELFWPLPVTVIPGIGPVTGKKLGRNGVKTVRDLVRFPATRLRVLLGENGLLLQQYASGIDYRELELERDLKSISEETTFAEDVYKREQVLIVLQGLSEGVGYRLRGEGFTARTITLKLRFGDFRTITRSRTLPGPVNNDSDIYRTIRDLFIRHCGRPPWRLVGVKASGFERGTQISLLIPTDAEKKERILLQVKDSLRDKYDAHVLYQAKRLSNKEPGDK